MTSAPPSPDSRAALKALDAEIRQTLRAFVREGDVFLRLLNRRDDVRIALADPRRTREAEHARFLATRLTELESAVEDGERQLTMWADRLRGLQRARAGHAAMTDTARPSWDENALIRLHEMVADSKIFLSLFSESYKRDPTALVQLVFAVMLEKPIYLLVPRGVHVPSGMRRLADGIEEYEPDVKESLEAATDRLLRKARLRP